MSQLTPLRERESQCDSGDGAMRLPFFSALLLPPPFSQAEKISWQLGTVDSPKKRCERKGPTYMVLCE